MRGGCLGSLEFNGYTGKARAQCLVFRQKAFFSIRCPLGHLAQSVHGMKQNIDHFLGQNHGLIAAEVQQILDIVEESSESVELQQGSVALDGVRRAKQRRNQLAIFGMRLQRQKRLLHLREALLGFFPERL